MRHTHGIAKYYAANAENLEVTLKDKTANLRRLEAQRNELNSKVRLLREEVSLLQEPGSYVGEVVKVMGREKVLVKINPEGKYVVDVDKAIDINKLNPNDRVALRNDSYTLHKLMPTKVGRRWRGACAAAAARPRRGATAAHPDRRSTRRCS